MFALEKIRFKTYIIKSDFCFGFPIHLCWRVRPLISGAVATAHKPCSTAKAVSLNREAPGLACCTFRLDLNTGQLHVGEASVLELISGKEEGAANRMGQSLGSALHADPARNLYGGRPWWTPFWPSGISSFSYLISRQTHRVTRFWRHGSLIKPAPLEIRQNRVEGAGLRQCFSEFSATETLWWRKWNMWEGEPLVWRSPRRVAPALPSPRLPSWGAYSHFTWLRTGTSRPTWRRGDQPSLGSDGNCGNYCLNFYVHN